MRQTALGSSILVEGSLKASISNGELFPIETYECDFDTRLLDNGSAALAKFKIEDALDMDDEVAPNGDIDIGEIVSQYLSLELF